MEKTLSKLLIGIGSWFGISLAMVDFMADGINWALINSLGTTLASAAAFEPTKMAVAGLLSLTSAFFAVRYIYLGVVAFAGVLYIAKDAPEVSEDIERDANHKASSRYTEEKSAQVTYGYDAKVKEAPQETTSMAPETTPAPQKKKMAA